jgi:hypothetical protein
MVIPRYPKRSCDNMRLRARYEADTLIDLRATQKQNKLEVRNEDYSS